MKIDKLCNTVLSIDLFLNSPLKKILFMLNWTILFTFLICLKVSASSFSQGVKVDLVIHEMQLKKAFGILEQKGKIRLMYSEEEMGLNKTVSLKVKNTPALDALQMLLKGTELKYQLVGDGLVVISNTNNVIKQDLPITGTVTDDKGTLLPGVSIRVTGSNAGGSTNSEGKYQINAPANGTLVFSYMGFTAQQVAINNRRVINVTLKEDATATSFVET